MDSFAPGIRIVDRARITSEMIGQIETYWQKVRQGARLPDRAVIDPLDMRQWLPYLSTVEIHNDPFRIRYRVVGTEVTRFLGEDFSNKWLQDTDWTPLAKDANLAIYKQVHDRREPLFGLSSFEAETEAGPSFEWAQFPLTSGGETVTYCLSVDDLTPIGRRSRLAGLDRKHD